MAIINGTDGNDKGAQALNGTSIADKIDGKKGDDELNGFAGVDELIGGEGSDGLDGGSGNDTLRGGFGSDTYFVDSKDDVIFEAFETIQDFVISSAPSYKLPQNTEQLFVRGFGNGSALTGEGNSQGNFIAAQFGASHATSGFILHGYGGNDFIQGDSDISNTIFGGAGNDDIFGGKSNDFLSGVDAGGGFGNDLGSSDLDVIDMGQGFAFDGADTLRLGDARGAYYRGGGFAKVRGFDGIDDKLQLAGPRSEYVAKFVDTDGNSAPDLEITHKFVFSSGSAVGLVEDKVAVLQDFISPFVKTQQVADQFLDSSVYIPVNTPSLIGTSSSNTLRGADAGGILDGQGGNDKLFSMGGDDIVLGRKGQDVLNGGTGDDLLWGGKDVDTLVGGQGRDTFVLAKGEGVDVIKDFRVGVDRLGFMGNVNSADISFVAHLGGTSVMVGGQAEAWMRTKPSQLSLNDVMQVGMTQLSGMNVPTVVG